MARQLIEMLNNLPQLMRDADALTRKVAKILSSAAAEPIQSVGREGKFTWRQLKLRRADKLSLSDMPIYRQLSCCGDENHAYGRMTLGVFPPDPKFRGYYAHQGRDASV